MLNIARLNERDRRVLFLNTSDKLGMHPAIVEKDFWVCYTLDYLFHRNKYGNIFVFKGGTSLSKAYHVIDRFSEDIDLILDWRALHYSDDESWKDRSRTQQDKFNKQMNRLAADFIASKFAGSMQAGISGELNNDAQFYIDHDDPQVLNFAYPHIFVEQYLRPEVRLEIGPLAEWTPSHVQRIRSFAADEYERVFKNPDTDILTVDVERTFWEKATILHKVAHLPQGKSIPDRYARHYYDLYSMSQTPIKEAAFKRKDLLQRDVLFKEKFYYSKSAAYETATLNEIQLVPPERLISELQKDYDHMKVMIYGRIPELSSILKALSELENEIHELNNKTLC